MLPFRTTNGASFFYVVDFKEKGVEFANLFFYDETRETIPFHLSLRRGPGLAVTNARDGQDWRNERPHEVIFAEEATPVEVRFGEDAVTVLLDGNEIFREAGTYPDLGTVRYVTWGGAVREDGVSMTGPDNDIREGIGELQQEPPLALWGWAFETSRPEQVLGIEVEGLEDQPQVIPDSAPGIAGPLGAPTDRIAFHAPLPGRIWLAADGEGAVRIHALCNGLRCGAPLILTRDEVRLQIEEIAARGEPHERSFLVLSAIEHVRFAGLFAELSEPARGFIWAAAKHYRALEFLFPPVDDAPPPPPPAPLETDPSALVADRIRQGLADALRANPDAGFVAALRPLLRPYPLPAAALRAFLLEMAEPACQHGEMTELHALAISLGHGLPESDPAQPRDYSLRLPFLLLSGDLPALAKALEALAQTHSTRISPAALAWTIRHLLVHETDPWNDRHTETALRSFMTLTEGLTRHYWRLPCAQMISATLALLTLGSRQPDTFRQTVSDFVLRCFGLSRDFWHGLRQAVAAGRIEPTTDIAAADKAFAVIEAHLDGDDGTTDDLTDALALFRALGTIDLPRVQREVFGPAGVPRSDGDTLYADIRSSQQDRYETALRLLAAPGAAAGDTALAETARATLRHRWNNVDKAPYYTAQVDSSRGILALFDRIGADAPDAEVTATLDTLMPRIRKLSGLTSGFLGLGLGVLTLEGLVRLGAERHAARVLATLGSILDGMPPPVREQMAAAASLQAALTALERTVTAFPSSAARAALSLFPQYGDDDALMPEAPLDRPGWAERSPLFDTLVTVFSCLPYLETRIPPMRAGWLADLEALGIPYVIVVGDGDGRIEGDIVHLDAPDDYEGLPQKTLKAVEWVFGNTDFSYMLKIDDDCFLNVEEYFFSQSYRKFHYYGRGITRDPGSMNRAWHHEKSRSERGRLELDKSPEPSFYADGGGGYMLSRRAMQALLLAARSPEGQRLIHSSFMEDKMAGDLLNMRGITVGSEDYYTTIWRRTHGPARPVMRWDNYFLPSAASPSKMIHLDTETAQAWTHEMQRAPTLLPRKLWPTFQRAGLGFNSNQLELLTDETALRDLNAADLAVICTCRNELDRLPAFLDHYRSLGVECFLFVDNLSDDGTREYLCDQPDCVTFSCDTHYRVGSYGTTWQLTLLANLRVGRWSLIADIDEFLVFPGWDGRRPSLPGYVSGGSLAGADAVRVQMIDMYPQGPLSGADLTAGSPFDLAGYTDSAPLREMGPYRGPFSNDRTLTSAVRHRLLPGSRPLLYLAQKYALIRYKPWMRLSEGLHYAAEVQRAEQDLIFCHFKYDAAFEARVREEVGREQHFNGAEEYRLYLAALAEGGLDFHDPAISVPWRESDPAKRLFA